MGIYQKLVHVQTELRAPKGQYNSFGKYKYRTQEDILEAVKPLLRKHGLTVILQDNVELIGDRYYIKATCILIDTETGEKTENTALARESQDKKGMDDSQITGTASSYARKYALNGLFLIDDSKDADTDEFATSRKQDAPTQSYVTTSANPASDKAKNYMKRLIKDHCQTTGKDQKTVEKQLQEKFSLSSLDHVSATQCNAIIKGFQNTQN